MAKSNVIVAKSNVIYNRTNIKNWQEEYQLQKDKYEKNLRIITENENVLRPLYAELKAIESEISSLQTQLSLNTVVVASDYTSSHHHHHPNGLHMVGDALLIASSFSLQSRLDNAFHRKSNLRDKMRPYETQKRSAELTADLANRQMSWLDRHIKGANTFIEKLKNSPEELTESLYSNIIQTLTRYDEMHPARQTENQRLTFYQLKEKMNELMLHSHALKSLGVHEQAYLNYLKLCAFLYEMQSLNKEDTALSEIFSDLISTTHIPKDGDLPDEFATGYSANHLFAEVKQKSLILRVTLADLQALEMSQFDQEKGMLSAYFGEGDPLADVAENACIEIQKDIVENKINHNHPDYKFYNFVLTNLRQALERPTDLNVATNLMRLAEHAAGTPSVPRQIGGALMIATGVIILGFSIAGLVATFGISSFASGVGVGLGLSMIESQILFGTTFSLTSALSSALTFFGVKTSQSGMRQGLSKEIKTATNIITQNEEATHHKVLVMA